MTRKCSCSILSSLHIHIIRGVRQRKSECFALNADCSPIVISVTKSTQMHSAWQVPSVVKVRNLDSVVKGQGGNVTWVQFTQEQAMKARRWSIGIALLFL